MEIRNIKSFKTIVSEGSFLKASKKLHYTQSTITAHIQQLEEELGVKLFEKFGRKMQLSSYGKKLLPYAEELLSVAEKIENLSKDDKEIKGELKIGVGDTMISYELQDTLVKFKELAPNVKLTILTIEITALRYALERGDVDLGFLYQDNYKSEVLVDVNFRDYQLSLICSPSMEEKNINFDEENQNLNLSFITNEYDCPYRKVFIDYLNKKNITMNSTIEIWSIEGIKRSVKNNLGISYLPTYVLEDEIKNGDLLEIKSECSEYQVEGIYSYHKNKFITAPMKLFMDLMNEKYKA